MRRRSDKVAAEYVASVCASIRALMKNLIREISGANAREKSRSSTCVIKRDNEEEEGANRPAVIIITKFELRNRETYRYVITPATTTCDYRHGESSAVLPLARFAE
jgi:hypothetical protein